MLLIFIIQQLFLKIPLQSKMEALVLEIPKHPHSLNILREGLTTQLISQDPGLQIRRPFLLTNSKTEANNDNIPGNNSILSRLAFRKHINILLKDILLPN